MISTLEVFVTAKELLESGKLSAGDVVEIDRVIYSHWVLYIGDETVVHVAGAESDIPTTDAYVMKSNLVDVANDSLVRINNKDVPARERGVASLASDVIVKHALAMVGRKVVHNLMTMNSEHFVTKCKYGTAWSDQAEAAYQGVFSSSPETDPQTAHKTMLCSLRSLLSSAQLSDRDDDSICSPKTPESSPDCVKSNCPKVVLFPTQ